MDLNLDGFKTWLINNKDFSSATISDTVSRMKRANRILPWFNDIVYQFRLEQEPAYQVLSSSVRSQLKRAVTLYFEFIEQDDPLSSVSCKSNNMKVLSLFSNIGVSETYLHEIGFDVVLANEIDEKRAEIYKDLYPNCEMITGDITDKKVSDIIIKKSLEYGIDLLMATPPCQGMSTAGKKDKYDVRNELICYAVKIAQKIQPKYIMFENVPMKLKTKIMYKNAEVLIPDYIKSELGDSYYINTSVINTADYGVPQLRERVIFLLTRKDIPNKWEMPPKENKIVTLYEAIGDLPILDPLIYDIDYSKHLEIFPNYEERTKIAEDISFWHKPPKHVLRQVISMQHTPTGETAFDNKVYFPVKKDGTPVKGYRNTYKRQSWDKPAYTITMYNRTISSQNNVHPGRLLDSGLYSDPRVLSTYELMLCMSLPKNWGISKDISESYLRSIIGEGIPPLFVKKLFLNIRNR